VDADKCGASSKACIQSEQTVIIPIFIGFQKYAEVGVDCRLRLLQVVYKEGLGDLTHCYSIDRSPYFSPLAFTLSNRYMIGIKLACHNEYGITHQEK